MSSRIALMLNGLYAIARKKSELNHQEKELIKSAAQTLEQALRKVEEQKAQMTDLQERIAIMLEGSGELQDDGTPVSFPKVTKETISEDFWAEDNCE